MIGLAPIEDAAGLPATARQMFAAGTPLVAMSGPPLMHGTGCWLGMMVPHLFGGTAVLLGGSRAGRRRRCGTPWSGRACSTSSSSVTPSPSRCCGPSTSSPIAGTSRACA